MKKPTQTTNEKKKTQRAKTGDFIVNIMNEKDFLGFSEKKLLTKTPLNFCVKSKGRWQYCDRNFIYMYV